MLTLKPLAFAFTQGKARRFGSASTGASRCPVSSMEARASPTFTSSISSPARRSLWKVHSKRRSSLSGRGASVHKAAASANGTLTVVIPSGRIRRSLAEWLGVNVVSGLGLTLSGDRSDTGVRCAVVHFTAKDGVLTARQFVFDTRSGSGAGPGHRRSRP